jgi:2-keto-4-pentenoate hydratase/2-oxohepta-3-ene-1,7-dioic acid hydratase in catechol pathway
MQLVTFQHRDAGPDRDGAPNDRSMGDQGLGFEAFEETPHGARRLGAVIPFGRHAGSIVDLNRALAVKLAGEDVGAPEAEADSLLPSDMRLFLEDGRRAFDAARVAFAFAADALERYDAPDLIRAGVVDSRRRVRLCSPVPRPGKLVGVARNYRDQGAERSGAAAPEEPVLFLKAPSAVIGCDDEILLPAASSEVDYEGELAVVIGRRAHAVAVEEAMEFVAGYCVANDVTARDFQNERGQYFIGKSCDSFAPLGPVLVSADEVPNPQDLALRTVVSGEVMQSGHTKEMIFSVAEILAFASRLMTLEPADVILTGTPAGVGAARTPPRWLQDGDIVEVTIDRVGRLHNYVRQLNLGDVPAS